LISERPPGDHEQLDRRFLTLTILVLMLGALAAFGTTAFAAATKHPSTTTTSTTPSRSTTTTPSLPVGFSRPQQISAPADADRIAAVAAISPAGVTAAGFGTSDEQEPGDSSASLAIGPQAGPFGTPRTVPNAQQVLSLAYRGSVLELLIGTSPHKLEFGTLEPCCSEVEVVPVPATWGFGARHTVIDRLNGATQARLVPVQGRLLAAVATEEGVWAAQSNTNGRFGRTRLLTVPGSFTATINATGLADGGTIVVWTARTSQFAPGPITIYDATGTPGQAPQKPAVAITVPATHEIDELTVAAHGSVPTVAWIESWYDSAGVFHSQAFSEDLNGAHHAQPISSSSVLASGLALGAAANGDEVIAFRACTLAGSCTLDAATRELGRFGRPAALGTIDPTQPPAVAESPTGFAMVGWVNPAGDVDAAVAPATTGRFAHPYRVSSSGYAADLALAFAPSGDGATAVWTQGSLGESVVAAGYTAPAIAHAPLPKPNSKKPSKPHSTTGKPATA
jgi:hypothetical protein